jgi:hypothetical protein
MRVSEKARAVVQVQAVSPSCSAFTNGNKFFWRLIISEIIGLHIAENEFLTVSAVIGFLGEFCDFVVWAKDGIAKDMSEITTAMEMNKRIMAP